MCRYKVNQHLIVPKLESISISKVLITEFAAVKVSQNLNFIQHSEINYLVGTCMFVKSKRMCEIKHSKTNRLQKNIEYQTNKQSTKYWN